MAWLPERLPKTLPPLWSIETSHRGLGGVAATKDYVIFSDRGLNDTVDLFKCVEAASGKEVWSLTHPASGNLDYGHSPRATPVIDGERVYLLNAFGQLFCVELKTGKELWQLDLRAEFEPDDRPKWGACSTPLLLDGRLIVNPGSPAASLAALDAVTGKILWKTPGKAAGYGSLIVAELGGVRQIIGHDADSLNGWDPETGKLLWKLRPERANDFNVPTPIVWDGKLIVCTENNGARLFQFKAGGKIDPKPLAVNRKLAPDTHTPVLVGDRLFGVWRRLYALDLKAELKVLYDQDDAVFAKYTALVATDKRVLAISLDGEFVLLDAQASEYTELGRAKVLEKEKGLYSHPAFVGSRVYVRGSSSLVAVDLAR